MPNVALAPIVHQHCNKPHSTFIVFEGRSVEMNADMEKNQRPCLDEHLSNIFVTFHSSGQPESHDTYHNVSRYSPSFSKLKSFIKSNPFGSKSDSSVNTQNQHRRSHSPAGSRSSSTVHETNTEEKSSSLTAVLHTNTTAAADVSSSPTTSTSSQLFKVVTSKMNRMLSWRSKHKKHKYHVPRLERPSKHRNILSMLFKRNFVSPAATSKEQASLERMLSQYHTTKQHLELHYEQLHALCLGDTKKEIIYIFEDLQEEGKKINYIKQQITMLKQMKQALKTDITAFKETMREGDGSLQQPDKFHENVEKELNFWDVICELNQDQDLI